MGVVSVPYTVPVQVLVDTESREVVRVVVIDENVKHDPEGYWEDGEDYSSITDQGLKDSAAEIAEEADWPTWEHGF